MNKNLLRFVLISVLVASSMGVGAKLHISVLQNESTMQTFFLCLTALYFRPAEVLTGQLLYLLAGFFYPVFSGPYFGVDILTGDTAGYLYAFPIAAWALAKYGKNHQWFNAFSWTVVAHGFILLIGFLWLVFFRNQDASQIYFASLALLPAAFLKSALSSFIYFIAEKFLNKKT